MKKLISKYQVGGRFFGAATPEVTDNNIYYSRNSLLPEINITAKGDPRKVNNDYYKAHSRARADLQYKVQTAPGWQLATLGAALPAAFMLASTVLPAAGKVLTNPLVDAVLTTHGAITVPKNIVEGVNEIKEGNYGKGALDLGLTTLDLIGAGNLIGRTTRILSPSYRAKHAFNVIKPASYEQDAPKILKEWLHDLWYNPEIDYKHPKWYKRALNNNTEYIQDGIGATGTGGYLPETVLHRGDIADQARIDAWSIYNGLPQQYRTYLKNPDGSYRYNLGKIIKDTEGTWYPEIDFSKFMGRKGDFVTGSHGGLSKSETIFEDNVGNGIYRIEDLWDVQPMKGHVGGKSFSNRFINPKLSKLFNFGTSLRHAGQKIGFNGIPIGEGEFELIEKDNPILRTVGVSLDNIGKSISRKASNNGRIRNALDKKFKNFELGTLTGGKPFFMKTNIPYHRPKFRIEDHIKEDPTSPTGFKLIPLDDRGFQTRPLYGFDPEYFHPMSNTEAEFFEPLKNIIWK